MKKMLVICAICMLAACSVGGSVNAGSGSSGFGVGVGIGTGISF
ncbi:hypothetical protein EDC49_0663 [Frederiksenia canicola]|uniref:Lipoprotein n=1 Tax=Frederiksenia canicola TaxID=123824 RepID=A0ABX9XSV6_9PAST|nr:hypothetical protein EDC49_0663 [Frederiksenia canicola]